MFVHMHVIWAIVSCCLISVLEISDVACSCRVPSIALRTLYVLLCDSNRMHCMSCIDVNVGVRICEYTDIYFRASTFRAGFSVASCCAKSNQIHDWITLVAILCVQQVSCLISHTFPSEFHLSLHVKPLTLSGWLDLEPVWLDLGPFWLDLGPCSWI